MPHLVHYIPLLTTLLAIPFAVILYRHWRRKPGALYLAWWTLGIVPYGVGPFTESLTTLLGWHEWIFRSWYISGALMGGAPLAQGTIYLLFPKTKAHRLTAVRDADHILVIGEDGRITAQGTHAELLEIGGFYAQIWAQQQLEAEIEAEDVA